MKPIAFDGKTFADLNVDAGFLAGGIGGPPRSPVAIDRDELPPIASGVRQGMRTLPINFTVLPGFDVEETRMALLGALQPSTGRPRVLVGQIMGDGAHANDEIEVLASTGQYRFPSPNTITVDFFIADDRWRARTDTMLPDPSTTLDAVLVGNGVRVPLNNAGGAAVLPELRFGWATQRGSTAATVGWKYIKQETISNTGTRPWRRVRKTVDLGDTAALVTAGKMQADGDDLRVRVHGTPPWMEIPRTLTNINTKRTLCHFYVSIPAGESVTYDFCYGNASATTPDTLSVRTLNADIYAADDLEGASGTATAGAANTLTDSGKTWETNRWRYGWIELTGGTGAGQYREIASNTGTVITVTRNWSTQPDNTTTYVIWMTGIAIDGGRATSLGTTTTIIDASQAWNTNEWKDGYVYNITQGIGPYRIISNTATTLTTATMSSASANNDSYRIQRYGAVQYMVNRGVYESAHRGLWRLNQYHQKGGKVWYGDQTPGGWIPWLMLQNQDDFALGRYVDEGSGGGHDINNWPGHYARRSVRSDNTWPEKGQHDGAVYFDPRAMIAIEFDYQMKNEGGVGQVALMAQAADGDTWQTIGTDTATRSTLANVTAGSGIAGYNALTGDETPVRVYLGVLPADGVSIPSGKRKDYSVELRNHAKMLVLLDLTDCGSLSNGIYVVGSETEVFDHQGTFRFSGGDGPTPPYDVIETNVLLAADRELRINPNLESGVPLIGVWNTSTGDFVERAPLAATIKHYELDIDGDAVGDETKTFTPIPKAHNLIAHPDDITGWTLAADVGVSAALANETGTVFDGDSQAIEIAIASAPAGPWTIAMEMAAFDVIPGSLYEFGAFVKSDITGLDVSIHVEWQENSAGGATSVADGTQSDSVTIASAAQWYPIGNGRVVSRGSLTANPTGGAFVWVQIDGENNVAGSVFIDPVLFGSHGPIVLYVTEDEPSEMTFAAVWREAYYA